MEPKEIQTSSGEVETKLKCRINIDIQNIENKYTIEENTPYLLSKHYFNMKFKNGLSLKCRINVSDQRNIKWIYLIICEEKFNAKDLISNHDLLINGTVSKNGSQNGSTWRFSNFDFDSYGLEIRPSFTGKFKTIKGFFEIECIVTPRLSCNLELTNLLHQDTFGSNTKELDFTILCKNKSFKFNKMKLCFMSDVFQKMMETSCSTESKTGMVEIPDFSPEVIEAFDRVMFKNDGILEKEDLTGNYFLNYYQHQFFYYSALFLPFKIEKLSILTILRVNVVISMKLGVELNRTNFELILIQFFKFFSSFESIKLYIFESNRTNFELIFNEFFEYF